jgi:hypothetical protein
MAMITRRALLTAAAASVLASRQSHAADPEGLAFNELYEREAILAEKPKALTGSPVAMVGYMAPPLKAEVKFFVLTSMPLAFCPFCETEAQWPDDIVLVLTREAISVVPFNRPIRVSGILETGFVTDPDTGFVSLIRIRGGNFTRV